MIYLMFNPLKVAAEIENYKLSSPCITSSMGRGRPQKISDEVIRGELGELNIQRGVAQDTVKWKFASQSNPCEQVNLSNTCMLAWKIDVELYMMMMTMTMMMIDLQNVY